MPHMKYLGNDLNRDPDVYVMHGEEPVPVGGLLECTNNKAAQLMKDFPDNWAEATEDDLKPPAEEAEDGEEKKGDGDEGSSEKEGSGKKETG